MIVTSGGKKCHTIMLYAIQGESEGFQGRWIGPVKIIDNDEQWRVIANLDISANNAAPRLVESAHV